MEKYMVSHVLLFFLRHNYLWVNVNWSNIEKFAWWMISHISLISYFDVFWISRMMWKEFWTPVFASNLFWYVLCLSYFIFIFSYWNIYNWSKGGYIRANQTDSCEEKNYQIHEKYQALWMELCSKVTSNKVCNFFCRLKDLLILGLYGLKDSLIGQNRHQKSVPHPLWTNSKNLLLCTLLFWT